MVMMIIILLILQFAKSIPFLINQYTARDTAGKGYGNLAANNGPTSEKPFTNEMQETRVQSLGWEDPLQEGMATHSSILAWKIP